MSELKSFHCTELETEESRVDPLEDEALIYYLQFGRHLSDTSHKKIKSVLNEAKYFKYEPGKVHCYCIALFQRQKQCISIWSYLIRE